MSNEDESDRYQVFLLRLWRAQCQGQWQWRASLESPGSGERRSFASLEQLNAYLGEQCERQLLKATELSGT
jgi:hypothetical protein